MNLTLTIAFASVEALIEAAARLRGVPGVASLAANSETPVATKDEANPKARTPKAAVTPPTAAASTAAAPSAPVAPPTAAPAPAPAPTPAAAPAGDLKTLADLVGRGVNENRTGTIEVLARFGAKKASQVPADKIADAITAMNAMLSGDADDLTS